jgi:Universal stress protein UspA and related nucleotide-binding proteins
VVGNQAAEQRGGRPGSAFECVLIGFDGSDGGRDALALARVLASPDEARVVIVVVFPYGPFPISFAALQEEAARDAEPLFAEAREALSGVSVETRVFGGGSPAWVMTDLAEKEGVDLIVVGSPHRGVLGRVLLGSVATNLLHGAPCPVAVAPRGFAAQGRGAPPKLIAVAYDGTLESEAALNCAEAQALATGASLRLLTVVGPVAVVPGSPGYVPVEPPDADKVLARGLGKLGPGVEAEGRRLDGPPAPTLAAACEDDVDLLVVGSRGYGPAMRVILGSVSRELVRSAPCPVLVTPRG